MLTRIELIEKLKALGFEQGNTVSAKWRHALVACDGEQTLAVLIRARGVDLFLTTLKLDDMVSSDGRLHVMSKREGDWFVEYGYSESEAPIHMRTLEVATLFLQAQPIDATYFNKVGIGRTEWLRKHGPKAVARDEGSMESLYEDIGHGDGQPIYLSDGVYLHSDGSTTDES